MPDPKSASGSEPQGSLTGIGTPDPHHEPEPPRIDDAGKLGPVGEAKQRGELPRPGIWGNQDEGAEAPDRLPTSKKSGQ